MKFYNVYILQSEKEPGRFYTGITTDLDSRLHSHNSGQVSYTTKYKPWRIKTTVAFTDPNKTRDFEKYLKSSTGRAFVKKHL